MRFTPEFLDEIRARLPVSDVVGRRVKLKKQGREWAGLSPFNKEKTPSFFVNDQKGFYHCFSSGKHGDIFGFLIETEGVTFPEAVERLAGMAGVEATDVVVVKRQWGAFYGTELDQLLRRRGIDTLVMGGIATNFGVESTARTAFDLGYKLVFAEDACSSFEADAHHFACSNIFTRMGRVRSTQVLIDALQAGTGDA